MKTPSTLSSIDLDAPKNGEERSTNPANEPNNGCGSVLYLDSNTGLHVLVHNISSNDDNTNVRQNQNVRQNPNVRQNQSVRQNQNVDQDDNLTFMVVAPLGSPAKRKKRLSGVRENHQNVGYDASLTHTAEFFDNYEVKHCGDTIGSNCGDTIGSNCGDTIGSNCGDTIGSNCDDTIGSNCDDTIGSNCGDTIGSNCGDTIGSKHKAEGRSNFTAEDYSARRSSVINLFLANEEFQSQFGKDGTSSYLPFTSDVSAEEGSKHSDDPSVQMTGKKLLELLNLEEYLVKGIAEKEVMELSNTMDFNDRSLNSISDVPSQDKDASLTSVGDIVVTSNDDDTSLHSIADITVTSHDNEPSLQSVADITVTSHRNNKNNEMYNVELSINDSSEMFRNENSCAIAELPSFNDHLEVSDGGATKKKKKLKTNHSPPKEDNSIYINILNKKPLLQNDFQDQTVAQILIPSNSYSLASPQLSRNISSKTVKMKNGKKLKKRLNKTVVHSNEETSTKNVKDYVDVPEKTFPPLEQKNIKHPETENIFDIVLTFRCKICSNVFEEKGQLFEHYNNVHKNSEMVQINVNTSEEMVERETHNSESSLPSIEMKEVKKFTCRVCGADFFDKQEHKQHTIECHLKESCNKMRDDVKDEGRLEEQNHPTDNYVVPVKTLETILAKKVSKQHKCKMKSCLHKFSTLNNLEIHSNCHLMKSDKKSHFRCMICADRFDVWAMCQQHLWKKHQKDVDMLTCGVCKTYKTTTSDSLNRHKKIHFEGTFRCDKCDKVFRQFPQLVNHQALHNDYNDRPNWAKKQFCKICAKWFKDIQSLKKHEKVVHLKVKNYFCNYCDYKCFQKTAFDVHVRQHTGEKPHHCPICRFKTSDHNSLRRHLSCHLLRTSLFCPFENCSYSARHILPFKNHVNKRHKGVPFSITCPECPFMANNLGEFVLHYRAHEKDNLIQMFECRKKVPPKNSDNLGSIEVNETYVHPTNEESMIENRKENNLSKININSEDHFNNELESSNYDEKSNIVLEMCIGNENENIDSTVVIEMADNEDSNSSNGSELDVNNDSSFENEDKFHKSLENVTNVSIEPTVIQEIMPVVFNKQSPTYIETVDMDEMTRTKVITIELNEAPDTSILSSNTKKIKHKNNDSKFLKKVKYKNNDLKSDQSLVVKPFTQEMESKDMKRKHFNPMNKPMVSQVILSENGQEIYFNIHKDEDFNSIK